MNQLESAYVTIWLDYDTFLPKDAGIYSSDRLTQTPETGTPVTLFVERGRDFHEAAENARHALVEAAARYRAYRHPADKLRAWAAAIILAREARFAALDGQKVSPGVPFRPSAGRKLTGVR